MKITQQASILDDKVAFPATPHPLTPPLFQQLTPKQHSGPRCSFRFSYQFPCSFKHGRTPPEFWLCPLQVHLPTQPSTQPLTPTLHCTTTPHNNNNNDNNRTWLNIGRLSGAQFSIEGLRDRAVVFIDKRFVGVLERDGNITSLSITTNNPHAQLDILVENQGRINFGFLSFPFLSFLPLFVFYFFLCIIHV